MESEIHLENSKFGKLQDYLKEFVYGGIDGAVTTFAVVAGGFGANLDTGILLILGFANLLADGFSMSVGAYLAAKSERDPTTNTKRLNTGKLKISRRSNVPRSKRSMLPRVLKENCCNRLSTTSAQTRNFG